MPNERTGLRIAFALGLSAFVVALEGFRYHDMPKPPAPEAKTETQPQVCPAAPPCAAFTKAADSTAAATEESAGPEPEDAEEKPAPYAWSDASANDESVPSTDYWHSLLAKQREEKIPAGDGGAYLKREFATRLDNYGSEVEMLDRVGEYDESGRLRHKIEYFATPENGGDPRMKMFEEWRDENGELHRDSGPAIITWHDNRDATSYVSGEDYYTHGCHTRAVEYDSEGLVRDMTGSPADCQDKPQP